ncbi:hypothetical protein [Gordonia sp. (in: high G+C Gram-positive bacteria)]|uniref:hypothetical protein n=1 Tax=Gordonia sp. (in: high G+C Gram-positive bacteria) TaxID=84139 RepID=UPI001DA9A4AC|nr:hypothetical protein [Gordonia sp. (in: high G+C Gram-positive bacteria)]MCB1295819.1 hypothetical protein [Gordonia sp. (in: high G+C Gram-positive bacteria)]HMS75618.1 hypothetical protein [Gordonia sp. (in: high G+C Gram-positive bacteria)]HQV20349.1 hypothetical protein [Gordonia sp. (in: high G+C Gram-positive bacteria)]
MSELDPRMEDLMRRQELEAQELSRQFYSEYPHLDPVQLQEYEHGGDMPLPTYDELQLEDDFFAAARERWSREKGELRAKIKG